MRLPNYETVDMSTDCVLVRDVGPWDRYPTITNAAEALVEHMLPVLDGRRLEYIDSDGRRSELLIKNGRFVGFSN